MNRVNYCIRCNAKLHLHNIEGFCSVCLEECRLENEKTEQLAGGIGSGRTYHMVEQAKEMAKNGKKVVIIASSTSNKKQIERLLGDEYSLVKVEFSNRKLQGHGFEILKDHALKECEPDNED